jgi:predicted small lipoprotein YifL
MRLLLILLTAISLTGCLIDIKPDGSHTVIVKPTKAQISAAAVKIVCGSFGPIYFSGSFDSADTVRAIRKHNAAWKSYGCKLVK